MALFVNPELCPQNHSCPLIMLCPMEAITQEGYGLPSIENDKCIECYACVENCGMGAIGKKD